MAHGFESKIGLFEGSVVLWGQVRQSSRREDFEVIEVIRRQRYKVTGIQAMHNSRVGHLICHVTSHLEMQPL